MTMRVILAASLLLLPVPAFAAPAADSKASSQPEKKICKVDPEDTDSRIRRRICKTESEWNGAKASKGAGDSKVNGSSSSGK